MISLKLFLGCFVLWNIYVFVTMGRDKRRAKSQRWRISEASLLWRGAVFGGLGLYLGMNYFRHKTAHAKFRLGAPLLIVLNLLVIGFLIYKGFIAL